MNEKITESNVLELWATKFPEVERWLTHLQKKTQSALFLYTFCEHVHKTPPELIALKEKDAMITPPPNTVEKMLDDFCGANLADFTNAEKYNTSIQVKSFFKWSYRSLEKAAGVVNWEKVKPYNALSKEGLRKLYNMALNPRDRALIPFVTCTGIAKETLTNLTWGHLEPNWETKEIPCISIGSELLKGHNKGKYAHVKQITFLTPEAKSALLTYKEWIEDKLKRKVTAQDHMWLETCEPYAPLGYGILGHTIIELSHRAKVPFSLHDGRRWVTTCLEQTNINPNWIRKIRGRKIRGEEAPYSQPNVEALRAKFKEALPLLEFTSETSAVESRLKDLEEKYKASLTPEQVELREEIVRSGGKRLMRARVKAKGKTHESCKDGHCGEDFKQVAENELLSYLQQGWEIAYKLSDGQVILKR